MAGVCLHEYLYPQIQKSRSSCEERHIFVGDPPETRTRDTLIKSQVLYQLS